MPQGYEAAFQRAIWTFQHQRVFDSMTKQMVHLRPIPEGGLRATPGIADALHEDDRALDFLGPPLTDAVATDIAAGEVGQNHCAPHYQKDTEGWQFQIRHQYKDALIVCVLRLAVLDISHRAFPPRKAATCNFLTSVGVAMCLLFCCRMS